MAVRARVGQESVAVLATHGEEVWLVRRGAGGLFPHTWTLPCTPVAPGEWVDGGASRLLGQHVETARQLAPIDQPSPLSDDRGPTRIYLIEAENGDTPLVMHEPVRPGRWATAMEMDELLMFREARECIADLLEAAKEEGIDDG